MLTIEKSGDCPGGVYRQYKLIWRTERYPRGISCTFNTWVGGCCGFNVLSVAGDLYFLNKEEFSAFLKEVSNVFKDKNYPENMRKGIVSPPLYKITQLFFLYGDNPYQRSQYSPLISAGKEVHRYVSGSEPNHETVMISIDL